ncbi:DUF5337 domain-containing protein [uncultured Roseobacter sp.]|uniref:DUF5337 domain-containing protein n=1 Tax=uncultured Roseobacter sp. TaxID=114847 RepID=UPI0026104B88|nr:DUF5337 domain-containing protein [uncultured Roseobacter sp.]
MSAQDETARARDRALAARGRMVSLVIVGTMVLWMLSLWLAPRLGLTPRQSILIDLFALAALLWSFIVSWQLKRARRDAQADR